MSDSDSSEGALVEEQDPSRSLSPTPSSRRFAETDEPRTRSRASSRPAADGPDGGDRHRPHGVAIYLFIPKIADLESAFNKLGDADLFWIGAAIFFEVVAFGTYVALFRGVVGGDVLPLSWREAYEINMAGLAATRLFSAGGAGGIALTYWALRKAGMPRDSRPPAWSPSSRSSTSGLPAGADRLRGAAANGGAARRGRGRGDDHSRRHRRGVFSPSAAGGADPARLRAANREASPRATAGRGWPGGWRRSRRPWHRACATALDLVRHPSRGGLALAGAIGFWAANIAILWASFKAFGVSVPLARGRPGLLHRHARQPVPVRARRRRRGGRRHDRRLLALRAAPSGEVFAAVLVYRVVAFWLPIPPGIVAFFQLRNDRAAAGSTRAAGGRPVSASPMPRRRTPAVPILQKVK